MMPVALFGFYFLFVCVRVVLNEDIHFARQSLEYYLLIKSEIVTSVPTGNCEVSYYYTGGDGNKSPANGIKLSCEEFPKASFEDVTDLIKRNGFADLTAPVNSAIDEAIKAKPFRREFYRGRESVDLYLGIYDGKWLLSVTHRTPIDL